MGSVVGEGIDASQQPQAGGQVAARRDCTRYLLRLERSLRTDPFGRQWRHAGRLANFATIGPPPPLKTLRPVGGRDLVKA